jgi:hypothetical protein
MRREWMKKRKPMNFECGMESYAITMSERDRWKREKERKKLRDIEKVQIYSINSPTFLRARLSPF